MFCVPVPWWTSKSTIATRSAPYAGLGVTPGDGGIVEEARTHRRRDFGIRARRANGDKGVSELLSHHLVGCEYRAPCRAKGRFEGAGRHRCVVVDGRAPLCWRPRADRLDKVERMDALDRRKLGPRRDVSRQHLEDLALQRPLDCAQTIRLLRMSLAHVMRQTRGVGDKERGDCLMSWLPKLISPQLRGTLAPTRGESPLGITPQCGMGSGSRNKPLGLRLIQARPEFARETPLFHLIATSLQQGPNRRLRDESGLSPRRRPMTAIQLIGRPEPAWSGPGECRPGGRAAPTAG